jgi:hypothetical protein
MVTDRGSTLTMTMTFKTLVGTAIGGAAGLAIFYFHYSGNFHLTAGWVAVAVGYCLPFGLATGVVAHSVKKKSEPK